VGLRRLLSTALVAVAALALAAPIAGGAPAVLTPPADGVFDYQLGGAYPPASGVTIVDRDRSDPPAPGVYGVCYVNGFQAQTGETRWWKAHHRSLLLRAHGRYVIDTGWDEPLLDISTPGRRRALARIVGRWFDGCARAGYRAVEPDNLDSYTRSHHLLTARDALAFVRLLAARAHRDGLAIAQKNAAELTSRAHAAGLDFAVAEECQAFTGPYGRECDTYRRAYGDELFEIEYPDDGGHAGFAAACAARGERISITYRDRDVTPRGDPSYVFEHC
jgi:hypothetical protein